MKQMANFQIDSSRRILLFSLAASLVSVGSSSLARSKGDVMRYLIPAPFTAQEFWIKILELVNEKAERPTRERVERAIGTQFVRVAGDAPAQAFFIDYGTHWYFNARFMPGGQRPSLEIWHAAPGEVWSATSGIGAFLDGSLLWNPDVHKTLVDSGWGRYMPSPHAGPENRSYKTSKATIELTVINNVISGIAITWLL